MSPHSKSSRSKLSRRDFMKSAALVAGTAVFGVPTLLRGANLNSRLNIAAIGAGGKGADDIRCCSSENIIALCDVNTDRCAGQLKKYPAAKFYRDFRQMFDEMGGSIDAVTISTPDHFHAIAASAAMQQGKHIYCQKPLTQTIYEARHLRALAQQSGLVTQMGNQGSAADGLRRAVECIQAGIIGQVREVHVWTNRPVWPQGMNRPEGADPIPSSLDWDIWLGPAPVRPFKSKVYEPFNWRGWQDFGTGALGDMACHTVNMPFRALNLGDPTEIEAEAIGGINRESYPIGSRIRFQFPARPSPLARQQTTPAKGAELLLRRQESAAELAPLTLHWYDGGQPDDTAPNGHDFSNKPPQDLLVDIEAFQGEVPNSACLILGDKGKIFSPDDYGEQFFIKLNGDKKFIHYKKHPAVATIAEWIPRNPYKGDNDLRHHLEWINAIKDNRPQACYSRFAIGAQLTEIMLLGCVALRCGKTIRWDGPAMRAIHCPEAGPFIKRDNRPGWVLA